MRLRYCDMMNFLPRSNQSRRRWRTWRGKAETNMFRNRNHLGLWYSAFLEMHHLLLVRGLVSKADSYPRSARTMACHAAFVAVFRALVSAYHKFAKLSQTFALNMSPAWSSHEEECISTQDVYGKAHLQLGRHPEAVARRSKAIPAGKTHRLTMGVCIYFYTACCVNSTESENSDDLWETLPTLVWLGQVDGLWRGTMETVSENPNVLDVVTSN